MLQFFRQRRFKLALMVLMIASVLLEIILSVVLTIFLRPNTLDIHSLKPADISTSSGNVYSGDLEFNLDLSLALRKIVILGRNEIVLAIMATLYMAYTIYCVQTALSTKWSDGGVPLSQIVAHRMFEDPFQIFSRQTATYKGLGKYTRDMQRRPKLPIRKPMRYAMAIGMLLAIAILGLNILFTWITIGSNRNLLIGGMDDGEFSTVELRVNSPKFGARNRNLGTRGCQPVPIFTDSLGGDERLNEVIYCTNIIFEGSRYIPIKENGSKNLKISTANLKSESVYRADLVLPGLGQNLLIVPPASCRTENGPLGFVTANPATKKMGADVQVEFSKPDRKDGLYKDVSRLLGGRNLYDPEKLSDDDFRESQLSGQVIAPPCIEWLEATSQALLVAIQVGLITTGEPRDTLEFNKVALRSRAALALLVGLSCRLLCCGLIFVMNKLFDTRQVDEITDVAITSSFPNACAQPLIRQPPRTLYIGLRRSQPVVEDSEDAESADRCPVAHLQLCSEDLPDQSEELDNCLVDGLAVTRSEHETVIDVMGSRGLSLTEDRAHRSTRWQGV